MHLTFQHLKFYHFVPPALSPTHLAISWSHSLPLTACLHLRRHPCCHHHLRRSVNSLLQTTPQITKSFHSFFSRCFFSAASVCKFVPKSLQQQNLMLSRLRKSLEYDKSHSNWVQIMHKSSGGRRPKKKTYYRVPELDRVMDLQKKPSLILQLKSILQSQKTQSLLLRDLEKEVGFVQKWNFMSVIEKYPAIFRVTGGNRTPPAVMLTEKAQKIAALEAESKEQMELILVRNLRKLLMLSVDCRLPLETVELIGNELGLFDDFKEVLIPKYPQFFTVKDFDGKDHLHLENWDSSLAVTAREERLAQEGVLESVGGFKKAKVSKDGNFDGPFAFKLNFPAGFRPNMSYLEEVQRWQKMEFPSPYLNARRFDVADPKARKRVVAVLHELLSLTMEKRLTSAQIEAFHLEYRLPARLLLCLIKHHAIFYITNKGARSTVFLKEAYDGSTLIHKCPLLVFRDKFVALSGRGDTSLCTRVHALHEKVIPSF